MDFGIILKMLIMACGVYMIYWAVQMKTTHQIPQMLVGKGFPTDRAKDPEGFMKSDISTYHGNGDYSSGCWIDRCIGGIWCVSYCRYHSHPVDAGSACILWHVSSESTEEISDRFRR